ncbi:cyclin-like protein, partial [Ramicandelaber brevisporus]
EDTSQFLNWRFSSSRLAEIRQANHSVSYERALVNIDRENELATAAAAAVNSGQQRQLSRPSPDTFTVYDSQTLVNYYAFVTRETALKVCQLPDSVVATAVTFFKRFFLHNTPIDYMPRNVSMTCIYLAIKAEMSLMSIDEFVAKVPKLKPAQIIDIEMEVSQSLQFEYTVHHPLRPLYGYFLDMQEFVSEIEVITSTYEKARTMIFNSLISDACFIYQPSQIALAAIQMAS